MISYSDGQNYFGEIGEFWTGTYTPTPTNTSWHNPVECRMGNIQHPELNNTDHKSWPKVNEVHRNAIRCKNAHREEMLENREKRKKDYRAARRKVIWTFRRHNSVIETRH